MPITISAKRALRKDRRRTEVNLRLKAKFKAAIKAAKIKKTNELVKEAYRTVDRAAKKGIIAKSKADRLKSRLVGYLKRTKLVKEKGHTIVGVSRLPKGKKQIKQAKVKTGQKKIKKAKK